jgi:hypothetical protein
MSGTTHTGMPFGFEQNLDSYRSHVGGHWEVCERDVRGNGVAGRDWYVGGNGVAGRDCLGIVQTMNNRTAHPCALCDIPFILNIIAARRASLYVGNLLCLAIREDGRRGETERLLRSENLISRSASTLPRHPPKRLYGI